MDEIEKEIYRCQKDEIKWNQYEKERVKLEKLKQPEIEIPREEIEKMIGDMKKLLRLEHEIKPLKKTQEALKQIENQLQQSVINLQCPSCEKNLILTFNTSETLELKENVNDTYCNSFDYEKYRSLEKQKCKMSVDILALEEKLEIYQSLKNQYDDNLDDVATQLKLLEDLKKNDDAYQKQKNVCIQMKADKPSHSKSYLEELKQMQKRHITMTEKRAQLDKITVSDDCDEKLDEKILSNGNLLKTIQMYEKQCEAFKQWSKVSDLKMKEDALSISYPRSVKLQSILKRAERMAIEKMVDKINTHAQLYIENFFLENISVSMVFDKCGGKNVENNKLTVEVFHEGHQSDLSSLSGGELARVVLAFTIALAEINNVKLLLLDECVASLDQETTTTVIDSIRKSFDGMVICIAHQTTTGVFDYVLDLEISSVGTV
jgi:DNA repair exonuclease SbcCD ATPase subunit